MRMNNSNHNLLLFLPLFFIVLRFLQSTAAIANEISVTASVDKKIVRVGGRIQLTASIEGTQSINAPNLPEINGFQAQYQGPRTQISIVNGQMSASVEHRFVLAALKVGKYTINPIEVKYKGKSYLTEPIEVEIVQGSTRQSQSGDSQAGEFKDNIYLTLTAEKDRVYLNEPLPITIKLYYRQLNPRDIEYPTILASAFSVREFTKPKQVQEIVDGVRFNCLSFQTVAHPVSVGQLTLGPAQLKCNLAARERSFPFDGFFDGPHFGSNQKRPVVLKSEPLKLTVEALPLEGKPHDFSGAIGRYALQVEAKPTEVKVGEPITLTMRVSGSGNIETIFLPKIHGLNLFKTYGPQIKTDEHGKSFEQVLIPEDDSVRAIPEIRFSYFDPEDEQYHTIKKGEIPIHVTALADEETLKIVDLPGVAQTLKREKLGRDILYIKDSMKGVQQGNSYLYQNELFLFAQTLPLLAFIGVFIYQKRKDRLAGDISYARQRGAPRKAKKGIDAAKKLACAGHSGAFCDAIFKTMQEYIGDQFALPSGGITSEVVDELRKHNVKEESLEKLRDFFEACDSVRFAPAEISQNEMQRLLSLTEEAIKLISENPS